MTSEERTMSWRHGHPGFKALRIIGVIIAGVAFAAGFALLFGWLVMLLWNWLMPTIFHLGTITYWEGFGIMLLAKIIFGMAGVRGPGSQRKRSPWQGNPWHGNPFRKESWHRGDWPEDRDWWRYYHEFWQDEGREAFERYKAKREAKSKPEGDQA